MIFTRIKVTNFGRFYAEQHIDVAPGVYIVHGLNGRGKTTLLNAVRWALYGHFVDRQGRTVPPEVTLNRAARSEGCREFSVELHISNGSDNFLLRRTQTVAGGGSPESDLYIERNQGPLSAADKRRAIDRLLKEDVSRFFLFDGEQLQQYETLLFSDDQRSRTIKDSIERILGLPVLEQAMTDLDAVKEEFDRRIVMQSRQSSQLARVALQAEQLQADLQSKQLEIDELAARRAEQEAIVADRDSYLQQFESSNALIAELDSLETRERGLVARRAALRDLRATALQHVWRDVLATAVRPRREEMEAAFAEQYNAGAERNRHDLLQQSLADGLCVICNRAIDEETANRLTATAGSGAPGERAPQPELADMVALAQLAGLTEGGHLDSSVRLDTELADVDSEQVSLLQDKQRVQAALLGVAVGAERAAAQERDAAQQQIGSLTQLTVQAEAERAEIEANLDRARAQLRASGQVIDPGLGRAFDLAAALRAAFDAARSQYRDELRSAVEASASEVFRALTTEPAYAGLSITDGYGLEILNDHGEIVTGRSAGQEQLVALALVAALNRNATHRATVIMDTPFGRLDPGHRANVLRYSSQMAEQVFFLAHPGEISPGDLQSIAGSITGEFELQYDDPDRTTLVSRSAL